MEAKEKEANKKKGKHEEAKYKKEAGVAEGTPPFKPARVSSRHSLVHACTDV